MDRSVSKKYLILLAAGLAVSLRLIALDKSFQGDEYFSVINAASFHNVPNALVLDTHPPLYFYMLNLWMRIYTSEPFLRLLSVMPGVGLCVLVYFIGKRTINESSGIAASIIVAFAPIAVWASQYIRTYSMASFFIALSVCFLISILKENGKGVRPWLGFLLASIAAIYTFYFSALYIIAENVFVFIFMRHDRKFLGKWMGSQFLLAASYIPWVPFFIYQRASYVGNAQEAARVGFYVGNFHLGAIIRSALGMAGLDPRFMAKGVVSTNSLLKNISIGGILALGLIVIILAFKAIKLIKRSEENTRYIHLFFILAVVPFITALVLNQTLKIILMSHYFIASFIFLVLCIMALFDKVAVKAWKGFLFASVLVLFACRLVFMYQDREMDFKAVHSFVKTISLPDEAIVSPSFGGYSGASSKGLFDYYFSDMRDAHYMEDPRTLRLKNKNIIFISYPHKLELLEYEKRFRSFLASNDYRCERMRKFGDLYVEIYTRP